MKRGYGHLAVATLLRFVERGFGPVHVPAQPIRCNAVLLVLILLPASAGYAAPPNDAGGAGLLLDSARMWQAKLRDDLARNALDKLLRSDPDHAAALLMLGLMELRIQHTKEARQLLERLRSSHPDHPATRELDEAYRVATVERRGMAMIRLHAHTGKYREAIAELRRVFPQGAPGGALGAEYYRILSEVDTYRGEARAGLERLVRESPSEPSLQLVLADFLIDKPDTRLEGIRLVEQLSRREDVKRVELMHVWRRGLNKLDNEPTYEPLFRAFLERYPEDGGIRDRLTEVINAPPLALAETEAARGHADKAERLYREVLRSDPGNDRALSGMGKLLSERDGFGAASDFLDHHVQAHPQFAGKLSRVRANLRRDQAEEFVRAGDVAAAERGLKEGLRIAPGHPWVSYDLARLKAEKGFPEQGREIMDQVEVSPDGYYARAVYLSSLDDSVGVLAILDRIPPAERSDHVKRLYRESLVRVGIAQAQNHAKAGRYSAAVAALEGAEREAVPDSNLEWLVAKSWFVIGESERALALGRRQLAQSSPEDMGRAWLRYCEMLNDARRDEELARALARLGEQDLRDESQRRDLAALKRSLALRRATAQQQGGQSAKARAILTSALQQQPNDLRLASALADLAEDTGDFGEAARIYGTILAREPANHEARLALARVNLKNGQRKEARRELWALLDAVPPGDVDTRLGIAKQLVRLQETAAARAILTSALRQQPDDLRLASALADLAEDTGDFGEAARIYGTILAREPANHAARLALARVNLKNGQREQARRELLALMEVVPRDDVDTRLGIAKQLVRLQETGAARAIVADLVRQHPSDERVMLQLGRIEKSLHNYEGALEWFRRAESREKRPPVPGEVALAAGSSPAQEEIQAIEQRRHGQVGFGFDRRELSGTPGISDIVNDNYLASIRYPVGYDGHAFAQVDHSRITAGTLALDDFATARSFGKIQALGSPGLGGKLDQTAEGTAFGIGYETDDWRFDIGTRPLGYPVSSVAGGIKYSSSWGDAYYVAEVFRRPVPNSLVSYAGARDPITGSIWGGVNRSGGSFYLGYDLGRLGLFAQGAAHYFDGKHVKSNADLMVRTGLDWAFLKSQDMSLTAGLSLMYWTYNNNQLFYSYGYGGYWSPQDYTSATFPVQWAGRFENLSFSLRAYVSYSWSREQGGRFYPEDSALQAQAETNSVRLGLPAPVYSGSNGTAFSYSVSGRAEYRLDQQWFLGARYEYAHSPFYTPNYMTFYVRYAFEPRIEKVSYPPRPAQAYYDY